MNLYFWRRGVAYSLDVAALALTVQITQWGLAALAGRAIPSPTSSAAIEVWVLLTVSLPTWLYFSLSEFLAGQTLGKRLMGLRVTRADGGRLSFGQALARTLVKLIPWELAHVAVLWPTPAWSTSGGGDFRIGYAIVPALAGLWIAITFITPRRQGLHDLLAGTLVTTRRSTPVTAR